jgi:branched-chain amino acid transport system substrate-binding protein
VSFLIRILLLFILAAPASGQQAPILVGAVVSQTGALAPLAAEYYKGLLVWQDEVNAAGGLLGRPVELRVLDDGSDAVQAGQLYAELIRDDKADLLIGPFGSAATLMAKAEAERARRVLINGSGSSQSVHKRASPYVFQTAVPNSAYGTGALELARQAGLASVFIVARDDPASREMGEATRAAAQSQGLTAGELAIYGGGTLDFSVQVALASAQGAQAWIAFGGVRDAADMVRTFKKLGYAPALFFARGAADPKLIELIGQDAEFSLGADAYDPGFDTPGNAAFVQAFAARWSSPPAEAAAEAYAAGSVLAEAVRRAGSLDQEKLRATLAALETGTVLGGYAVDPESGAQLAARPAVVQILRGKREIVWPPARETAKRQPYPAWADRRLIE